MAKKIVGLFKGKKKSTAEAAPAAQPAARKGPIITPLGSASPLPAGLPANLTEMVRRRRLGQGGNILSDTLG